MRLPSLDRPRLAHSSSPVPADVSNLNPFTGHTILRLRPEYQLESLYDLFDADDQDAGLDRLLTTLSRAGIGRSERITLDIRVEQILAIEAATDMPRDLGSLTTFWRLDSSDLTPQEIESLVDRLNAEEHADLVEVAYREGQAAPQILPEPSSGGGPCPGSFKVDETTFEPSHRGPQGINSDWANTLPGGTGGGIALVDIERNWCPSHDHLDLQSGAPATTIVGDPYETKCPDDGIHEPMIAREHGTAVLGVIKSKDAGQGVRGIAQDASPIHLVSYRFDCNKPSTTFACCSPHLAYAICRVCLLRAVGHYDTGDVLLLEYQHLVPGNLVGSGKTTVAMPAEVALHHLVAIHLAVQLKLTVVEPAGNSGLDLANWPNVPSLDPHHTAFFDSGAIVVGAACPSDDFPRHKDSNFGDRVDCFAWGANIRTLGACQDELNLVFGMTSGASAIIAGACLLLQSRSVQQGNGRMKPSEVRSLLADATTGITSTGIGVMPDLSKIL